MASDKHTPREIGPSPDGSRLHIAWADGVTSALTPRALRLACPCAGCVDELTGKPILDASRVHPDVYPQAIHYVGRYALQFEWSDGHSTGIYPFDYLRKLGEESTPGT